VVRLLQLVPETSELGDDSGHEARVDGPPVDGGGADGDIIPSTMTDKEMAADLGRYIIRLQTRIKALQSVLMERWPSGLPDSAQVSWAEAVKAAALDDQFQKAAFAQRRILLQAIGAETQDSALIRVLHSQFLPKGPIEGNTGGE